MTVRHVPERTRDRLAERAARSGRSLQEYVLGVLVEAADRPSAEDALQAARARARSAGAQVSSDEIVGALRDVRDRP